LNCYGSLERNLLDFVISFEFHVLTVSISNSFAFDLSIQQASAIKHIASSLSPTQSKTTTPVSGCINYDSSTKTITVSCNSARLSDVYNQIYDNSILAKQSQDGNWFLSTNLVISKDATFYINSTDTKWLKISSLAGTNNTSFGITVYGSLKVVQ
jgi:mannuronan 5-epimerase